MPHEDDYAVGYRKPPQQTQFAKGRSGNLKGRPKGSRNFATVLQDELGARVDITENGKRKKITKREAVAKQLVNKAAAGDAKAIPFLLNETRLHEARSGDAGTAVEFDSEDQLVIANIMQRIVEACKPTVEAETQAVDLAPEIKP